MLVPITIHAEDGSAAWLRYAPVSNVQEYQDLPSRILVLGNAPIERSAASELERGLSSMLGRRFAVSYSYSNHASGRYGAIVLATMQHDYSSSVASGTATLTSREAYRIRFQRQGAAAQLVIAGATPAAELYGVFHLLEEIAAQRPIPIDEHQSPAVAVRWTDEWDNLDGSIERGYAGQSIFFDGGRVRQDLTRAGEYARVDWHQRLQRE
jgi:alpha-glucuronidase